MTTSRQILNPGQDPGSSQKCKAAVQCEPCIEIRFEDRSNDFKARLSLLEIGFCGNLELNNSETENNTCKSQSLEAERENRLKPQSLEAESEKRLKPQVAEVPEKQNQEHPYEVCKKTLPASKAKTSDIAKKRKVQVFIDPILQSQSLEPESEDRLNLQSLEAESEELLKPQVAEVPEKQNQEHPHEVSKKTLPASNAKTSNIAKKRKVQVFIGPLLQSQSLEAESEDRLKLQSLEAQSEERLKPQVAEVPEKQNQEHPYAVGKKILPTSNANTSKIAKNKKVQVFTCPICKVIFNEKYHLIDHLISHRKENPFSCNICKSTFPQRDLLRRHKEGCHLFMCEICHCKFLLGEHLNAHLEIHNLENNLACPLCDRIFTKKADLITHYNVDYHLRLP